MAVLQPYKGDYYLWKYLPSIEAAAIFCVLFALMTFAQVWRISKTRGWFGISLAIGGFMEIIGYATRASARDRTETLMPYAVQNFMILLAPVLFAASIYMTLGRAIRAVNGEKYSTIKLRWLTKLFVTGDVVSLLIQGSAAGLMVVNSAAKYSQGIIVAGLVMQILMFVFFCITTILFQKRMRRNAPTAAVEAIERCERTIQVIYATSALILFRSVFRVVEFAMGNDGYLLSTEWPVYVFDSVPMLFVMAIFWKWFPSFREVNGEQHVLEAVNKSGYRY